MAAFTEMAPGASLHYLMTGDQQNAPNTTHGHSLQPSSNYAFVYGMLPQSNHQSAPQLVPYQQQQQQRHQQQQQISQAQPQQMQRPRAGGSGSGLPPTPPGSPRPQVVAAPTNAQPAHSLHDSAIKQQAQSTFASPVRTQHPSQSQQQLPLYPQPSPLHPTANLQNIVDSSSMFMKQQQQQQQQQSMFWANQQQQQQQQQVQQQQVSQNNPVPTMYDATPTNASFPVSSTSPSLVHALSLSAQQRRQRSEKKQVPDDLKDDKYFERRKRNNVAAKKSRDSRKAREDEISIRASFLEKENAILRAQVATLRDEASSLRQLLMQKQVTTTNSGPGGPRPNASSTPNAKGQFALSQQQQPQHHHNLAAVVAQQAAAAAYAAAFATSNMHHSQQSLNMNQNDDGNQQAQDMIHSAA